MTADSDPRAEFLAGLLAFYNFYADHPDFPAPYRLRAGYAALDAPEFQTLTRQLGGRRDKEPSDERMHVTRQFGGGIHIEVHVERDEVCTRRQVGTVTELRPAPDAPMVEVEVPVWAYDCDPILAERDRLVDDAVDAAIEARHDRQAAKA